MAVGTYEVWVRLTNDNYCHLDGSMERQIGTFKISTGKPTYYTLTLKSGGGEQMTMPVAGGSTVVLPENSFEMCIRDRHAVGALHAFDAFANGRFCRWTSALRVR